MNHEQDALTAFERKERVLCRWINFIIGDRYKHVSHLSPDLCDGLVLLHLGTIVLKRDLFNGASAGVYCVPHRRAESLTNVQIVLDGIESRGGAVVCEATEVVDGVVAKMEDLVMQFVCMRHHTVRSTDTKYKVMLLKQTRQRLRDVAQFKGLLHVAASIEIFNVSTNFADGTLFLALLYHDDPELFDIDQVRHLEPEGMLKLAFKIAEDKYDVPPLLNVGHTARFPDEDSISVYLGALLESFKVRRRMVAQNGGSRHVLHEGADEDEIEAELAERIEAERRDLERREQERVAEFERLQQERLSHMKERSIQEASAHQAQVQAMMAKQRETEQRLQEALIRAQQNERLLQKLSSQVDFQNQRLTTRTYKVDPPTGYVAVMVTRVHGSAGLWEANPKAMAASLMTHNSLVREVLAEFGGYEVHVDGDSFTVTFSSPKRAVEAGVAMQLKLLEAHWDDDLLECPAAAEEISSSKVILFRGLRVAVGIHVGVPIFAKDEVTGRMAYFGPIVETAAALNRAAQGGQVLASGDVWDAVASFLPQMCNKQLGHLEGSAVAQVQVNARALAGREFTTHEEDAGSAGGGGGTRARASADGYAHPQVSADEQLRLELEQALAENRQLARKIATMDVEHQQFAGNVEELHRDINANKDDGEWDLDRLRLEVQRLSVTESQLSREHRRLKETNAKLQLQVEELSDAHRTTAATHHTGNAGDVSREAQLCIQEQQDRIHELEKMLATYQVLGVGGSHHPRHILIPALSDLRPVAVHARPADLDDVLARKRHHSPRRPFDGLTDTPITRTDIARRRSRSPARSRSRSPARSRSRSPARHHRRAQTQQEPQRTPARTPVRTPQGQRMVHAGPRAASVGPQLRRRQPWVPASGGRSVSVSPYTHSRSGTRRRPNRLPAIPAFPALSHN